MRFKFCIFVLVIGTFLSGCRENGASNAEPEPFPRDVTSPIGLSTHLADERIFWAISGNREAGGSFMRLDGTDPISVPLPDYAITVSQSSNNRYFVYGTNVLPEGNIELLDIETGERIVLVRGKEHFPGASIRYPSFSPDDQEVIFEVVAEDRIDLAIVEIETGNIRFLDLQGGFNMWPSFAPDGETILVGCEDEGRPGFTLCILDQELRTRDYIIDDLVAFKGEFTDSGQYIAYMAIVGGTLGEAQLHTVDIHDQAKKLLVSGLHSGAIVLGTTSEDVIFTCRLPEKPACSWVCVVGLDGRDVRRLTYLGESCTDINEP